MAQLKKEFLIGASTAAHQVEGNNIHSDFWAMEHLKHSSFVEPSGDAIDHYNLYEEDIKLLRNAGLNAYRFSIEWARIEPEEGHFDHGEIEHYRKVLQCCLDEGVTPIVTLHHFSSPAWLIRKGGWGKEYVVNAFSRYCGFVAEKLGSMMPYICTINEANMGIQLKKIASEYAKPNRNVKEGDVQVGINLDMKHLLKVMFEQGRLFHCSPFKVNTFLSPRSKKQEMFVMKAHQAAYGTIKSTSPSSRVGLTISLYDYQTAPNGEKMADKLWYEDFGFYLPYITNDDFLGVQNYSRKIISANGSLPPAPDVLRTQMDYEDYPAGISNVIRKVAKEFKGELIITENGIATSDDARRCEFIKEAIDGINTAINDGIPILGYCYWSLLDNFEWQAGYSKTFGLIAVDRTTQERKPKDSLKVLGRCRTKEAVL